VTARVIARSPTVWYSTVKIDKGSDDGIEEEQPVVTGDGLVGRIESVTDSNAIVTLITDSSSSVTAQVMPDGATGVVKPEVGDPNDLLLEFIKKGKKVTKNSVLVTSGFTSSRLESLFPRGIPIGKVTKVNADELELYQRVHIQPFADLRRMDYVQVLTSKPDTQQARAIP
jgi:rod shape-determining protein MreC